MKIILPITLLFCSMIIAQETVSNPILNLEQNLNSTEYTEHSTRNHITSFSEIEGKKSAGLAIVYSLLLPGMGELYADGYSSGKYFTIADGLLWGTYIGMSVYANNQEDNYKSYATSNAKINPDGKDANYFSTIGEYSNIDNYNDQKALERNFDQMYDRDKFFWKWQTTVERRTYRDMWSSSEQTFNDLRFIVGALIVNRIASAINAVRLVAAYNSRLEAEMSWNLSVGLKNNPNLPTSLELTFHKSF